MANKAGKNLKSIAKGLTVRFVKKANMYVATFPKEGKTVQQWFDKEPTEEQLNKIRETL
jgi:hypothetical protein